MNINSITHLIERVIEIERRRSVIRGKALYSNL